MRRWFGFHRDLGFQLLALYLLLIVPFLITLLVFNRLVSTRTRADVEANDLSLARAIAQETGTRIGDALQAAAELTTYRAVINNDPAGMESLFKITLDMRPDASLVYRLDANGIMSYHYPPGPSSTVGEDFSFREYFQRSLQSTLPLISQGRISPTTNQAVATAVMPIWLADGAFSGVAGINLKLESLSSTLAAIISEHQAEEGLQIIILDSDNKIIAYPEPDMLLHPAEEILPESYISAIPLETSSTHTAAPDGVEKLYTFAPIPKINWSVIVSRPTSAAFQTGIILQQITQIAAATFILIGLFFWGTLSIRVIRPLEQLAPISQAIGMNQPISLEERTQIEKVAQRTDQIGRLIRSILRMEGSIADRLKEQATLLETSTAVVSSLDLQTVLDRILEQMGRLLQIQMYAIVQLDPEKEAFRIRASRGLSKRFTEQLTILPSEPDSVTMRAMRAREPIFVSDTESDPSYINRRALARSEGYRALLAVPLNTKHAPKTALLIFHRAPHEFSYNEIQLLSSFANQAAMAIENAILFERSDMRLQEQSRRLEALIQSMEDGLILSNLNGRVIYANRRISELTAAPQTELAELSINDVLSLLSAKTADPPKTSQQIRDLLEKKSQTASEAACEFDCDFQGRRIHLRLESFDVMDAHNTPFGLGLLLHDVTVDREVDRMKSSLISTVSHELRTPLAAIKGYASTLLAEDVEWDRASQKEFVTIISDEADRLTNLVNNLLDLSRIEAGSLRLSPEECVLPEMIQRAARQAHLLNTRNFKVEIEPGLPTLFADPPRLETIIRNLIENSLKYAGEQASIQVRVYRQASKIIFQVADNGPGIPPQEAGRIFDSFYRIDNSFSRIASGAGLGLAICQGLVRAHGGEIWVEPHTSGACIAFSIPLEAAIA